MSEILRVVHDGRPCFWYPFTRDDIPIEGKGIFIGPSTLDEMAVAFRIVPLTGSTTHWQGLSEDGAKVLIRMLAEGMREFEGVTHVPEKK